MRIPAARGRLGAWLRARLEEPAHVEDVVEPDSDDDATLALWILHELSFRGFDDADPGAEQDPVLVLARHRLELAFERRLRQRWAATSAHRLVPDTPAGVPDALRALVASHEGPSLATYVRRHAGRDQALALLRQRSVYHLKEADPTSFVVPRLPVRAKAALVELQYDEYGDGDPNRLHAHLFARGLASVGLSPTYGAYVEEASTQTLELNNAASLFGLQRRLRGAATGHLAAFEMTSALPSRAMSQGLERLGLGGAMAHYYDEHVEADAIHEQLAATGICGSLADEEPDQVGEILFGAWTCLDLESRFATAQLASWDGGRG